MKKDLQLGNLPAYYAAPNDGEKHPGLIVIEEIWGVNAHIKDVADRFAAQGYVVLAPELLHDQPLLAQIEPTIYQKMQSEDPEVRDSAQQRMRAAMAPIRAPEFSVRVVAELTRCVDYLINDEQVNDRIAVLGFCFGGTYAFKLASTDERIKAAVPFYGQAPTKEEIATINCPVLAFYGDQDEPLMETLAQLTGEMEMAGKPFEAVVYQGTGHAFFNDTNVNRYHEGAAEDAWARTLEFLKQHVG